MAAVDVSRALAQLVARRAALVSWHPVSIAADDTQREIWTPAAVLPVWTGASDSSIYGAAAVNWQFRAWHDACHLRAARGFDLASELYVSLAQSRDVQRESGYLADVIWADNAGQQLHFYKWGRFPADQAGFVAAFLAGGLRLPNEVF